ncbi:DNA polymerase zeta catalytic subunit [Iris pallida]|uniref:DNA polymerase zeta catalytic subunit n=1 Tax=Iris pallida TaxID=29817 RepID=A0AAX6H445_IRIPA|nr:DNA polymerase zeta catalytic subunit [Iris pallida]
MLEGIFCCSCCDWQSFSKLEREIQHLVSVGCRRWKREVNIEKCPRNNLQQQCNKYLGPVSCSFSQDLLLYSLHTNSF